MPSRSLPHDLDRLRSSAQPWPSAQQSTHRGTPAPPETPAGSRAHVDPSGGRGAARHAPKHHPCVRAALCYAVPVVPGWWTLTHERRNPFVRFHAAQSLIFFGLVAAGQVGLYGLLVLASNFIADMKWAIGMAAAFVVLYLAFAVTVAVVWLRLLASCIRGDAHPLPLAGRLAFRLQRFAPRAAWRRWWNA